MSIQVIGNNRIGQAKEYRDRTLAVQEIAQDVFASITAKKFSVVIKMITQKNHDLPKNSGIRVVNFTDESTRVICTFKRPNRHKECFVALVTVGGMAPKDVASIIQAYEDKLREAELPTTNDVTVHTEAPIPNITTEIQSEPDSDDLVVVAQKGILELWPLPQKRSVRGQLQWDSQSEDEILRMIAAAIVTDDMPTCRLVFKTLLSNRSIVSTPGRQMGRYQLCKSIKRDLEQKRASEFNVATPSVVVPVIHETEVCVEEDVQSVAQPLRSKRGSAPIDPRLGIVVSEQSTYLRIDQDTVKNLRLLLDLEEQHRAISLEIDKIRRDADEKIAELQRKLSIVSDEVTSVPDVIRELRDLFRDQK